MKTSASLLSAATSIMRRPTQGTQRLSKISTVATIVEVWWKISLQSPHPRRARNLIQRLGSSGSFGVWRVGNRSIVIAARRMRLI